MPLKFAILGFFGLLITTCSGGGGGGSGAGAGFVPPTGNNDQPTYTKGVYTSSSTFDQRCEAPRTGVDSVGNAFVDVQGSTTLENFWNRSWTNETYLWKDEVPDLNPYDYSSPTAYFDTQKSTVVTDTGQPRDEFHFWYETEDYLDLINSAPTAGYGASITLVSSSPPREARVVYTDENTPASAIIDGRPAWERGMEILAINGIDFISATGDIAIENLNAGLFPATAGRSNDFTVRYTDGVERTVTLVSADLEDDPVNNIQVFASGADKVGYIQFNTFFPNKAESEIVDAITQLQSAGISDLILDLRYNGGGKLDISSQLGYMVAGSGRTSGKTFEALRFNNGTSGINPVTGQANNPIPFRSTTLGFSLNSGTPLPELNLSRVYVLTTANTCSASEALINGLRGIDLEVVQIGSSTCGKPYGFYGTENCGYTFFSIQFEGLNDKGEGGYVNGFKPLDSDEAGIPVTGCFVADDFTSPLGNLSDPLVAAALEYRQSGQCPSPPAGQVGQTKRSKANFVSDLNTEKDKPLLRDLLRNNRDMNQQR